MLTDTSLARICRALLEAKTGMSIMVGPGLGRLETLVYGIRVVTETPSFSPASFSEKSLDKWLEVAVKNLYTSLGAIWIEEIDLVAKANEVEF